ncbi:MAG: GNAT family N-acetyltransferase [Alphaproteobacteria bacterium]|nr:GNAT family N-acetyltransferase [Alphaproteobacteria bacterium]
MAPYPAELEEQVRLADGLQVFLRPIRAEDAPALQELFARMSPEDRRLRFFAPLRELSAPLAFRLTHVDYEHALALLAFAAETGAILGVARLAVDPARADLERGCAEFAVALRSDLKGHGLGRLLVQRLLRTAPRLGATEICGYVLRENDRMLHLCRDLGFAIEPAPGEPEAVLARRRVAPAPDSADGAALTYQQP